MFDNLVNDKKESTLDMAGIKDLTKEDTAVSLASGNILANLGKLILILLSLQNFMIIFSKTT